MTKIEIGDYVRSFDFDSRDTEGPRACFIEGVVTEFVWFEGCPRYHIRVMAKVEAGVRSDVTALEMVAVPPVNGTPKFFGGVCDQVEKIPVPKNSDRVMPDATYLAWDTTTYCCGSEPMQFSDDEYLCPSCCRIVLGVHPEDAEIQAAELAAGWDPYNC